MRVKTLIEVLKKLSGDLEVYFPDGTEVTGAELVKGRLKRGYYSDYFNPSLTGKVEGVMFTHFEELSTGECVDCIKRY
jgi:hypothetical protein